jgi:hypothetical protein
MIGGRAHRTQPSELQAPVTSVAGFMVEELSEPFGPCYVGGAHPAHLRLGFTGADL